MNIKWLYKVCITLSFFVFLIVSCTKMTKDLNDPKVILEKYVNETFTIQEGSKAASECKTILAAYFSGDLKTRFMSWSSDQFDEAFLKKKRKFEKLVFKDVRQPRKGETQITFELTYSDLSNSGDKSPRPLVTQKRLAVLTDESGQWLIKEIRNIKEVIEYENAMAF